MRRTLNSPNWAAMPRVAAISLVVLALVALPASGQVYRAAPAAEPDNYLRAAFDQIRSSEDSEKERQYIDHVMKEFADLVNGTWTLVDRFNPDGTRHSQPLTGWTEIALKPIRTSTMATRAFGTIQAEETGVWDARMGSTGPPEALGKPFFVESNGTWEVMVDPDVSVEVGAETAHILVAQMSTVRGTYAPYSGGLIGQLDSRYLMTFSRTEKDEDGRTRVVPTSLKLKLPITPHRPETFRGRPLPSDWLIPVNFDGEAIPESELARSDCSVKEFSVEGDEMRIEWSSGARDIWKKEVDPTAQQKTP